LAEVRTEIAEVNRFGRLLRYTCDVIRRRE